MKTTPYKHWTTKEEALLRELWPTMGSKCIEQFPGRSASALMNRATLLGIVRMWSEEDMNVLRKHYPDGGSRACLKFLSIRRDYSAIHSKARRLGLRVKSPWLVEELEAA